MAVHAKACCSEKEGLVIESQSLPGLQVAMGCQLMLGASLSDYGSNQILSGRKLQKITHFGVWSVLPQVLLRYMTALHAVCPMRCSYSRVISLICIADVGVFFCAQLLPFFSFWIWRCWLILKLSFAITSQMCIGFPTVLLSKPFSWKIDWRTRLPSENYLKNTLGKRL